MLLPPYKSGKLAFCNTVTPDKRLKLSGGGGGGGR